MIKVEIEIGNDAARAARREIRRFLDYETSGMTGERSDRQDTAALGYVVLRRFLEILNHEVARQDAEATRPERVPRKTVREERR